MEEFNALSRLYDNFDQTQIGANIVTLALQYATRHTPIVLIINEIDDIYNAVYENSQSMDPRGSHTSNKLSFTVLSLTFVSK